MSGRSGERATEGQDPIADEGHAGLLGRPVRVLSISFNWGRTLQDCAANVEPLAEIAKLVDKEEAQGAQGTDLIALPACDPTAGGSEETLDGATISLMSTLAKKHQTYIACPIDRKDGKWRFNSVVLLGRRGQVACVYDKVFPWLPECDPNRP